MLLLVGFPHLVLEVVGLMRELNLPIDELEVVSGTILSRLYPPTVSAKRADFRLVVAVL